MADGINPALTPDEWAAAYAREDDASLGFEAVHSELVHASDFGHWHKAMALANAALPETSPAKLTWDDIAALRTSVMRAETIATDRNEARDVARRADMALAKIASLLPPP